MRRLIVATLIVIAVTAGHAQTAYQQAALADLGLGPITSMLPVELNGTVGAEYLVKTGTNPFSRTWVVICPQAPAWNAGTVDIFLAASGGTDTIADTDGDGVDEIVRFNAQTQEVTWLAFPTCAAQ